MKPGLWVMVVFLVGCDLTGTGGGGKDGPSENGFVFSENAYSLLGDTILIHTIRHFNRYCSGDSLHVDTFPEFEYKVPFEIHSDSMFKFNEPIDTLPSGTRRIAYDVLVREGDGQGLIGLWSWTGIGYRILAGEPSAEERKTMDSSVAARRKLFSGAGIFTRYSQTRETDFEKVDYGHQRAAAWSVTVELLQIRMDSVYDMDVRAVDSSTFEMKGRRSGETVRETRFNNGDMEYVSDVPSHHRHRYAYQPQSCPNPEVPDWYIPFLEANLRRNSYPGEQAGAVSPSLSRERGIYDPGNLSPSRFRPVKYYSPSARPTPASRGISAYGSM
jgi:hypothetical protein